MVKKIENKRKSEIYNPSQGRFLFSKTELETHKEVLDEFKYRHQTLSDKIKDTYTIGNRMLDYLEK